MSEDALEDVIYNTLLEKELDESTKLMVNSIIMQMFLSNKTRESFVRILHGHFFEYHRQEIENVIKKPKIAYLIRTEISFLFNAFIKQNGTAFFLGGEESVFRQGTANGDEEFGVTRSTKKKINPVLLRNMFSIPESEESSDNSSATTDSNSIVDYEKLALAFEKLSPRQRAVYDIINNNILQPCVNNEELIKNEHLLQGSVRSGKTFLQCLIFIKYLLLVDEGLIKKRGAFCIISKSHKTLTQNILTTLSDLGLHLKESTLNGNSCIILRNGLRITSYSYITKSFNETIQGATIQCAIIDECSLLKKNQFEFLQNRLSLKNSFFIATANPKSTFHYLYKRFIENDTRSCYNHHFNLLKDAPYASKEYIKRLVEGHEPESLYYRRYILGSWVDIENTLVISNHLLAVEETDTIINDILLNISIRKNIDTLVNIQEPTEEDRELLQKYRDNSHYEYYSYISHDRGHASPACWLLSYVVFNTITNTIERIFVHDCIYYDYGHGRTMQEEEYNSDLDKFIKKAKNLQCVLMPHDSWDSTVKFRAIYRGSVDFTRCKAYPVENGVSRIRTIIANGKLKISKERTINLQKEFNLYKYKEICQDEDGTDTDTIIKQHDHAVDALRLLVSYIYSTLVRVDNEDI